MAQHRQRLILDESFLGSRASVHCGMDLRLLDASVVVQLVRCLQQHRRRHRWFVRLELRPDELLFLNVVRLDWGMLHHLDIQEAL